jgi:hypothetical protein
MEARINTALKFGIGAYVKMVKVSCSATLYLLYAEKGCNFHFGNSKRPLGIELEEVPFPNGLFPWSTETISPNNDVSTSILVQQQSAVRCLNSGGQICRFNGRFTIRFKVDLRSIQMVESQHGSCESLGRSKLKRRVWC